MKLKKITSAELVRYNANSSGNMSPDCVKRAISLAFDISYTETAKLLNARMKELRKSAWNIDPVYTTVINDLAANASSIQHVVVPEEDRVYLQDFVDTQVNPSYVYLILTGKTKRKHDHIVCVRDGKIFDSWDSRDQWVTDYWVIKGLQSKAFTDIKDHMEDLANNVLGEVVEKQIIAYMQKKKWDYGPIDIELRKKDYQLIAYASLMLKPTPEVDKKRFYDFKVVVALTPTMTKEEATAYIQKAGKQKTYDKMWAINEEEKKLAESEATSRKIKEKGGREGNISSRWLSKQEEKFLNSLPGWVKPLITGITVQNPGQYSDSYSMRMHPHPDDPTRTPDQILNFEGWESWQIRDELDKYLENWSAPFEDYYPADIY